MLATLPEPISGAAPAPEIEVSVVMPCLNEAKTVGVCVAKAKACLERLGVAGEVVIADNGSTDGSQAIAKEHGARVVNVERKGYGSALQGGIASARGRFIIMGDADDSYDFTNLGPFVERLRAGDELVMGNRFKGGIKPGAMPWLHRYVGNPVLSGILNLFFRTPVKDAHCGLRGFRKDSYEKLRLATPGMEFASEMVVKASLLKQKISEVPTTLSPDGRDRPPHLRSFRDGWRHLRFLLLMCPLWLYLIPATALLGGGLAVMLWLTGGPRIIGSVQFDVHTMLLGALAVFVGYQTLWLWAYARIYGWTSGILPDQTFSAKVFKHLNLERGVLAGAALLLGGLALIVWLFRFWWGLDMGPLDVQTTFRPALWGFLLMILGVQTIYGSFFLSMLGMNRDQKK
ncbi:MAG: glycosyltransferase family 2 protein [Acidobacteriales bacterium]|nr:glycosyltransferase family 2 protein [Terriglobales bacterium]